ncbi:hypothetical protein BZM27_48530 [Paraburkholderia steynii]|uniref:Uncharacterized protein n=1 Tax=Paraburkholderia steynii TaxID=1245441 RepID=A0A4R0X9A3_9BURK|nr:hypothetical protein BZM27_48530 [Paraburkholderia steynii]
MARQATWIGWRITTRRAHLKSDTRLQIQWLLNNLACRNLSDISCGVYLDYCVNFALQAKMDGYFFFF